MTKLSNAVPSIAWLRSNKHSVHSVREKLSGRRAPPSASSVVAQGANRGGRGNEGGAGSLMITLKITGLDPIASSTSTTGSILAVSSEVPFQSYTAIFQPALGSDPTSRGGKPWCGKMG